MKKITLFKMVINVSVFLLITISCYSQTVLSSENFNSGFGIWTSGGASVIRQTSNVYEGSNSVRFSNGGSAQTLTSPALGISTLGYDKIDVKFFVSHTNASVGETITLRYRNSTLAAWTDVRIYTIGNGSNIRDVNNSNTYHAFYATLFSSNYTFGLLSQFQFISNLGGTTRYIYLDNVSITGTTFNTITYGPGGITNGLDTWLKADMVTGTSTQADNTNVDSWQDVGKGNDANVIDASNAALTNRPKYKNNATNNINFNPVVQFNNNPATDGNLDYTGLSNRSELNGTGGFSSYEQFIVVMNDTPAIVSKTSGSIDLFCAQGPTTTAFDRDGTGFGFGQLFSVRFDDEVISYCHGSTPTAASTPVNSRGYGINQNGASVNYTYSQIGILSSRNNSATSPTGNQLFLNANRIDNQEVGVPQFSNFTNRRYWLGRSQVFNGSFGGRIAEVITFTNRKDDTNERRRIESYLAIKYGITLGVNGTSMNYQDSSGNVIWDQTANAGFNYDIAGIGLDTASQLNQKQSKSINPTEVMTIGLTDILPTNTANTNTFATNKSFLVWGANGGNMNNSGTNLNIDLGPTTITTITEVVNRKWKVVEVGGDIATTRVSVPTASFASGLPALGPNDAYVMVVSTNATFTAGLETVFMTTSGTDQTLLFDFDGTKYITFGVAHRATNPLHITLDGFDDYVRTADSNEIGSTFSIMTWVRPDGNNTLANERTIIAKTTTTNGYKLVLQNDNRVRMEWRVGATTYSAITNAALPNSKWHNIAVTYGANTILMYIDGVVDRTATISVAPVSTASTFSIGAQYINKTTINNLWKGDIDELRMWNRVVSATEIRFIMNQEILQNGTGTIGTIIPSTVTKNDISSLLWSNLFAYYSMNSYIGTHLDDDSVNHNRGSLVIPDKISINVQTAPMPYISSANGLWANTASWANGAIQDLPYSVSIIDGLTPIDWNIVRTTHDINSSGNKVLLGLFVNSSTLSATNDSGLEITHYLKLNGKIDLVGKSQLVQKLNSDLDPTSSGSIEKDQLGQKSLFNYNYWSSPVGTINATTNNNAFTVAGVMKDGTTATPQNLLWTGSYNGSPTTPAATLSTYWIYKFSNLSPVYANWQYVGQTGSLLAAQGFTLKGSGTAAANQTYTFVGKPNNGTITTSIAANNLNLVGNPYASALDANAFITANTTSTTGVLYFWEHYSSNTSHNLAAYQGGYATKTLTGATPPAAPVGVSGLGSSSKTPKQYIPVGQAFFVEGSATGGTITFSNGQREFAKEDNVASFTLFKSGNSTTLSGQDHFNFNQDIQELPDTFKRVRLGMTSAQQFHREILIGFMEQNATEAIDPGYDAINIDPQPSDIYFMNSGKQLTISGEGYLDANKFYPLGVTTNVAGDVTFTLDNTENMDANQPIYIYDNIANTFNEITQNQNYIVNLPQTVVDDRFFLTFSNAITLGTANVTFADGIQVVYTNATHDLSIKNSLIDTTVESVLLFNMLGQQIANYDVKDQTQTNIVLPVKSLSAGTYIVKMVTDKGDTSRKIIIN